MAESRFRRRRATASAEQAPPAPRTFEVRVWLPDRPGALGEVATRIGSLGGDVVGIEILETGGGSAIDDLTVTLPVGVSGDDLVQAIAASNGVAVEEIVELEGERPDPTVAALEAVRAVVGAQRHERLRVLCAELQALIDGDWAVVIDTDTDEEIAAFGGVPDAAWLNAFLAGSAHLSTDAPGTPSDIVWCHLPRRRAAVASGRSGRTFHARERDQVCLLGEIVDSLDD